MKKTGLVVAGFGMCFLLAGCQSSGGSSYKEKHYEGTGDVQTLEIADDNIKINVVGVSSEQPLTIDYYESKNVTYTINDDNNKLSIKKKKQSFGWNIFSLFNWNFEDIEVTVQVPENQLKNLTVKTENGKIVVENLTVGEAKLKTTNGKLLLEDTQAKNSLKLETTNGKVEMANVQAKDIKIDTTNAKITFDQLLVEDSFKAETTNGKISGTIEGSQRDFKIDSKTTNGDNSLSNSESGSKDLKLKTTNGAIRVDFSED
ncbi:DUF4097 family beta strand repeat-containing protein [uncultured Enterococcus sp.]|uniref:DUF4097 family beta strand repeat-containing protein n=1 Tax=uncultured Enterococcus sp. TaxID=167972 RepID=UPI002AA62819|nr:DUF4097 family beta strand repeat-containing protein [uncultured Enterococcus sp.]